VLLLILMERIGALSPFFIFFFSSSLHAWLQVCVGHESVLFMERNKVSLVWRIMRASYPGIFQLLNYAWKVFVLPFLKKTCMHNLERKMLMCCVSSVLCCV
jgi:hypothetical protein